MNFEKTARQYIFSKFLNDTIHRIFSRLSSNLNQTMQNWVKNHYWVKNRKKKFPTYAYVSHDTSQFMEKSRRIQNWYTVTSQYDFIKNSRFSPVTHQCLNNLKFQFGFSQFTHEWLLVILLNFLKLDNFTEHSEHMLKWCHKVSGFMPKFISEYRVIYGNHHHSKSQTIIYIPANKSIVLNVPSDFFLKII